MCRSAGMHYLVDKDQIKIRAFCVRLILCNNHQQRLLPDSLTLIYLPRITGSPLHIDGSNIRPDSPAFLTLHRVLRGDNNQLAAYVSKEQVRATEGVKYEVYLGDVKLLNGVFRSCEDEWTMGCKCLLEEEIVGLRLAAAEVCVAAEGMSMVCEKVEMVVRRRRRKNVMGLEEIPEAKEEECYCCCCSGDEEEEEEIGGDRELTAAEKEEMEDMGWVVDVGLWMMCLGVGLLVSKASSRRLGRRKFF
ncbi:unnamed protein product [Rhodiola kirilowii]